MGMILVYEIDGDRKRMIEDMARLLGHQVRTIEASLYGEALGYVAGIAGFPRGVTKGEKEPFGEEMMVFSGLDGNAVDLFLAAMRERKLSVGLKAVLTPYNIRWNSRQLYEELVKERTSIRKRLP